MLQFTMNEQPNATWGTAVRKRLRELRDIYEGLFFAPYRAAVHREHLRQRDLLYVMGVADLLGVPNPVAFYTLELYPEALERFHEWHTRLGMEEPPEGGFRCC